MSRVCSAEGCEKALGAKNASGFCRSCIVRRFNACPEFQARRAAGIARAAATPEGRAKLAANARKLNATYWERPENKARHVEHGRKQYETHLVRPDVRAKNAEAVGKAARKRFARMFAWCPAEYREEYTRLVRSKRMPAAQAKAAIQAKIAADRRNETFEQKLERVARGELGTSTNFIRHHLTPTLRNAA